MTTAISHVERMFTEQSGQADRYAPTEKLRTLVVDHFPTLGKVTALRFLEWAQQNPDWTVALPTGKTPEHFIKWTGHLLQNWETPQVRSLLENHQIDPGQKPDLSRLRFVQIDEFYPIDSTQANSFFQYVHKYYLHGFGFDPAKALLIDPNSIGLKEGETLASVWGEDSVDLSLRTRIARTAREERQQRLIADVDQFCYAYEAKIRSMGGIGFFLGGIGPDGHIGFNVRGSDHYSTTRLCETNYETQAAAASDLGGIEVAAKRLVITIGLGTITYNKDATAIIMAAGEAKAPIVKAAIEAEAHNRVPASALQVLPNACFYVTRGAAIHLTERRHHEFNTHTHLPQDLVRRTVMEASLATGKKLMDLQPADFNCLRSGSSFLEKLEVPLNDALQSTATYLGDNLNKALDKPRNEIFLHTAPHHDDIMLGYLPYLVDFARDGANSHVFNYLTSGFNAVTNGFMGTRCGWAQSWLATASEAQVEDLDGDNDAAAQAELDDFITGLAREDAQLRQQAVGRRLLRCLGHIYSDTTTAEFSARLSELDTYFGETYPGMKDVEPVQKLKGMMREWEAEVLWCHLGFKATDVVHSRLGFYKGDIFTEEPEMNRDVLPLLALLKKVRPTVVTVALDPEGSGPDTHYKVLQAVSAALKLYREQTGITDIKVWGYRNVWYRFNPADTELSAPVSLGQMAELDRLFLDSFASQRDASFPSYALDGPFSALAKQIQVEQYDEMATWLGEAWFAQHPDRQMRGARGMVHLKVMDLDTFFQKSRELKRSME